MLTGARKRAESDSGMTMMELVVTMAVMTVVVAILFGILDTTSRIVTRGNGDLTAANNLQLAMRTMSEDVRAATQITFTNATSGACPSAPTSGNCLSFVVSHNVSGSFPNCKTTVTYGLVPDSSSGTLTGYKIARTTKQTNCASTLGGTTTLLSNVQNSSLFSYYDGAENALSVGQAQAKSIQISLAVIYTKGGTPVTLSGFVALRNAR